MRSTAVVVAAVVAATIATVPAPAGAAAPVTVRASQDLATLTIAHAVRAAPRAGAEVSSVVPAFRPITGSATVLPVTARRTSNDGRHWLRVRLPGRPNSSQGWIVQGGTIRGTTAWHIVVRTSARRVLAYRGGRLVRSLAAIVGKPSTPSPRGRFFVEESIDMPAGAAGGPYALATSARSNVLQEFAGGPGQIGIHGVENLGGTPGTAVSHGCIRLSNASINWLALRIRPGTPVTIAS